MLKICQLLIIGMLVFVMPLIILDISTTLLYAGIATVSKIIGLYLTIGKKIGILRYAY